VVPTSPSRPAEGDPGADAGDGVDAAGDRARRAEQAVESALATIDGAPVPASGPGPARRAAVVVDAIRAARATPR
jgi:hypothetical protein